MAVDDNEDETKTGEKGKGEIIKDLEKHNSLPLSISSFCLVEKEV